MSLNSKLNLRCDLVCLINISQGRSDFEKKIRVFHQQTKIDTPLEYGTPVATKTILETYPL